MNEERARALFLLAGIDIVRIHELLNQYWRSNDSPRGPWWLAETRHGTIRIGWRKRVISIDWEGTKLREIITEDEVTKEPHLVHAWSYLKALEYLSLLAEKLDRLAEPQPAESK